MRRLKQKDSLATTLSKLLLSVLIFYTLSCDKETVAEDPHSRPIKDLTLKADRLLISKGRSPDFYSVEKPMIDELGEGLQIVSFKSSYACLCDAEIVFYFYKGEEMIMALGHHFDGTLRWHDAKWEGDAVLSEDSLAKIMNWRTKAFAISDKLERGVYTPPALE